ncbi:MAG: hypothetical protein ABI977_25360 [Acidobacteriota bacterium]
MRRSQKNIATESFNGRAIAPARLRRLVCATGIILLAGLISPFGLKNVPARTATKPATKTAAICVNPGGTGGCLASIQAAINAAANGDTINVAAGMYTEDLNINKSVALIGAGADATIVFGVSDNATSQHVVITAPNVTLEGFTIDDFNSLNKNTPGANNQGVAISNVAGVVIRRNIITNVFMDAATGGTAIYLDQNPNGALIEQNTITNSGNGILFDGSGLHDNFTVRKNLLAGNGRGTSSSRAAIRFASAAAITAGHRNVIAGNSLTGNLNGGGINNASGIPVIAENNWWGCNFGPGADGGGSAGCSGATNGVSANVDANPWLVLKLESLVGEVVPGGGTNLTASLLFNSDGTDTSASGSLPDRTPVAFATTLGAVSPAVATTTDGRANAIFNAGSKTGQANISAAAGSQNVSLTVKVGCPPENCEPAGIGLPLNAASPLSDSRAGSILFFNIFTSGASSNAENTRISLTNIEPARSAFVHLFLVDGGTGGVADAFVCLTPGQTTAFLASDLDPGVTGYIIAIAVDDQGCPINFNFLIGDEYVKFSSGHATGLGAEAVTAIGNLSACNAGTATIAFDGVQFSTLPRALALDNLPSRTDGNNTLLILNHIGGSLVAGAATLGTLSGTIYDDMELGLSFSLTAGACQFRGVLSNSTLRTDPRWESLIPAGRSGWMKIWIEAGAAASGAMTGAAINANPNAKTIAKAYNQGHTLHHLTVTTTASLIVPVIPPTC